MISFALLRVWQRIKNRLIQNIWLLLRLILGFTLLFFSITLMQSADQTAKEERYNDSSFKRIALLEKNEINTNERQLSQEDILNLSKEFPNVHFSQIVVSDIFLKTADDIHSDRIILANPAIKKIIGQTSAPDSQISSTLNQGLSEFAQHSGYKAFIDDAMNK